MASKIAEIEGIGAVYAEKLIAQGIKTTDDLLAACGKPKGRKELAEKSGISEALILKWTNHADLMRIKGIGRQFAELLEAAGVDTVKELRQRKADNLAAKMKEINAEKKLSRATPAISMVARWIEQAKTLEAKVSY